MSRRSSAVASNAELRQQVRDALAAGDPDRARALLASVRKLVSHGGDRPEVGAPRGEVTLAELEELARELELAEDPARP